MRVIVVCVLWLAAAVTVSADSSVAYTMSPVLKDGALSALAIEMRFAGDSDGETKIELPNSWGGYEKLYQAIQDFTVTGEDASVAPVREPAVRMVRHKPGALLTVSYRVVQYWDGEPAANGGNEYRPVIQLGYFHVLGNAVFALPDRDTQTPATFAMKALPAGWNFASDLEHATAHGLTLDDLVESVSVGGDFRIVKRGQLRVAIRGTWKFSDDGFVNLLQPIIASHYRFWSDAEKPYLVTAIPIKSAPENISVGGTGREDAFAFFATNNAENQVLNRLLAHEHLHTWIPRRIGGISENDDAVDYWLSEGFTDFYTARLLVRAGIWSPAVYAEETNALLLAYGTSAVRTEPNSRIVKDFWNDPAVERLPYQRGQLLAMMWDAKLRTASGGKRDFDDVMLAMHARVKTSKKKTPLAAVLFGEEMRKAGADATDDRARFVEKGEAVLLPENIFAPCGKVATLTVPEFDRGFDPNATTANGNIVTGLREDSPGYRAGLRNGMKILKRESGKVGDSRVEMRYRLQDGQTERVIAFRPEGVRQITFQEFTIDPALDEAGQKACSARLSGLN